MNRDDVIRMAREAGFWVDEKAKQNQPNCISHTYHMIDEQLERFAALVAAAEQKKWEEQTQVEINEAILDEREACAKLALDPDHLVPHWPQVTVQESIAAAIRVRSPQ